MLVGFVTDGCVYVYMFVGLGLDVRRGLMTICMICIYVILACVYDYLICVICMLCGARSITDQRSILGGA